jgi:hypothetical protein
VDRIGLSGDRTATAKPGQLGAIRRLPGNLQVRGTAWWSRKDSNYQPDRYERSVLKPVPVRSRPPTLLPSSSNPAGTPRRGSLFGQMMRCSLGGVAMITPERCRERAAECVQMAERAPNRRVQDILLDIARTWTRLAFEAEQWSSANRPTLRLKKGVQRERATRLSVPSLSPRSPASRREPSDT